MQETAPGFFHAPTREIAPGHFHVGKPATRRVAAQEEQTK